MRGFLVLALLCVLPVLAAAAGCTSTTSNAVNPQFHATAAPKWADLQDETEFRRFRVAHAVSSVEAYPAAQFSGRGVVMTIADSQEVASAYVALQKLRATGNVMPVELFHAGVLTVDAQAEFEAVSGVTVRSVSNSDALMPAAVQESSFTEVLLLSARTHALVNPASVFETAEYQSTGLVMWPALHMTSPSNPIWGILNTACVHATEQSGAAAVINKSKAWAALAVAAHLRGEFYQAMFNGDDSVLHFGALATNTAAHTVAVASKPVGATYTSGTSREFCTHSMLLASPSSAEPMFLHTAGTEVVAAGYSSMGLVCMQNVGEWVSEHDDALVAELVRLQVNVPEHSSKMRVQACQAGQISEPVYEALVVGPDFLPYYTTVPLSGSITVGTPGYDKYQPNCGNFFSQCGGYASSSTDTPTFFFGVRSRDRSANIRVEAIGTNANLTLVRVMDHGLRRSECDIGLSTGPSYVNHNIVFNGTAIVAVAWDNGRAGLSPPLPGIQIKITYRGASSGALSSAVASLPLLAGAMLAAILAIAL